MADAMVRVFVAKPFLERRVGAEVCATAPPIPSTVKAVTEAELACRRQERLARRICARLAGRNARHRACRTTIAHRMDFVILLRYASRDCHWVSSAGPTPRPAYRETASMVFVAIRLVMVPVKRVAMLQKAPEQMDIVATPKTERTRTTIAWWIRKQPASKMASAMEPARAVFVAPERAVARRNV
jgi:hypothetical protein